MLEEGSNVLLGEDLPISTNVAFVQEGFPFFHFPETDKVSRKSFALDLAIRTPDHGEFGLLSDHAFVLIPCIEGDGDVFTREEIPLEFVENGVDWFMLDGQYIDAATGAHQDRRSAR